jgi:hypothetical protein
MVVFKLKILSTIQTAFQGTVWTIQRYICMEFIGADGRVLVEKKRGRRRSVKYNGILF